MILSIQKRIIILLLAIGICMVGGLIISGHLDWQRVISLLEKQKEQRADLLNTAVQFRSESIDNFVFDYTYWDDMLKFAQTGDTVWANENIVSSIPTFKIDYAWVYRPDLSLIYSTHIDSIRALVTLPMSETQMRSIVSGKPLTSFFIKSGSDLIEISEGSIHPTIDQKRQSPPFGYLFVGRIWTHDYLKKIGAISRTELNLLTPENNANHKDSIIPKEFRYINYKPLFAFDHKPIAIIASTGIVEIAKVFHEDARLRLSILAIILILILSVVSWALIGIINRPLKVLVSSLKDEDTEQISELVNQKTEFGRIAQLINEFLLQKKTLINEIDERKKMEIELIIAKDKAEESDRLKTSFLNNISHEIRTPINAIVGFSDLIKDPRIVEKERAEFTEIIVESSYRLMGVITDLINLSTVESGTAVVKEEKFSLNILMHEIYGQIKPLVDPANLTVTLGCSMEDSYSHIISDKIKLHQIIMNLLKNSIKFTKTGRIEFGYVRQNSNIEFYVKDTGIGIPAAKFDAIFARFQQVDDSLSKPYGGAGLGLPISKAYTELMGGRMWFKSEVNKGTEFYFAIPYKI